MFNLPTVEEDFRTGKGFRIQASCLACSASSGAGKRVHKFNLVNSTRPLGKSGL